MFYKITNNATLKPDLLTINLKKHMKHKKIINKIFDSIKNNRYFDYEYMYTDPLWCLIDNGYPYVCREITGHKTCSCSRVCLGLSGLIRRDFNINVETFISLANIAIQKKHRHDLKEIFNF